MINIIFIFIFLSGFFFFQVYGALMWSMGKVFDNPEVVRVYIGSFWDQPLRNTVSAPLLYGGDPAA